MRGIHQWLVSLCEENLKVTGGFPSQRAIRLERVSMSWCHHYTYIFAIVWSWYWWTWGMFNTLSLRQNGCHIQDDIFKCIFLNENVWIVIKISLKFVPKSPINNIPSLVQIMAWCRPGNKPLSEPMLVSLLMHICFTGSQWVEYKHIWTLKLMWDFTRSHPTS